MPEISRFLGIVIRMHYGDHAPPHFHAKYGNYEISVEIETGLVEGRFPRRGLNAVLDWYAQHEAELLENWRRLVRREPLLPIPPLE